MSAVITMLLNGIVALFYFMFYYALIWKDMKLKDAWWKIVIYIVTISAYMFFSIPYIDEPYRTVIMLIISLFLFSLLLEKKKVCNYAVVLTSFIVTTMLLFISVMLTGIITYFIAPSLFQTPINRTLAEIPVYFIIGLFSYNEIKSKSILPFLKESETQSAAVFLSIITFAIYFYMKLINNLIVVDTDFTILTIIFACIIMGAILAIFYQIKRYRERKSLESQNFTFAELNATLEKTQTELMAKIHTDEKIFPSYMQAFDSLFARLFEDMSKDQIREFAKTHMNTINQLKSIYIGEKLSSIKNRQQKAELPKTTWEAFNILYYSWHNRAIASGVELKFNALADIGIFEKYGISQFDILKILADHIDNSFKELTKSKKPNGIIRIWVRNSNNVPEIKIEDSAHEFSINILENLGKRGITTSGTGHGFSNTLDALSLYNASLIIREYAPENECLCNKGITFRFDGLRQFKIQTYRANEIKSANSNVTIEQSDVKKDIIKQKYTNLTQIFEFLPDEQEVLV